MNFARKVRSLSTIAVVAVFLVTAAAAHAQQTTGVPGSPSATTTIDGEYSAVPTTSVRRRDQHELPRIPSRAGLPPWKPPEVRSNAFC